jgi:hypothetical protein
MTEHAEKTSAGKRIPILLDLALTTGKLLMVGSTSVVVALSVYARCDALWIAVRAGVTLLATGLLTWSICWMISHGSLAAVRSQLQEAQHMEAAPALLNKRA